MIEISNIFTIDTKIIFKHKEGMPENVQIVKMDKSILEYFRMINDFDNQGKEYAEVTEKEFIRELTKSLNCGRAKKKIVWV